MKQERRAHEERVRSKLAYGVKATHDLNQLSLGKEEEAGFWLKAVKTILFLLALLFAYSPFLMMAL